MKIKNDTNEMTVHDMVKPLQKRLDRIEESLYPMKIYSVDTEKRIFGTFEKSFEYFDITEKRKGKNGITKTSYYENILKELSNIEKCILNFEEVHKVDLYSMLSRISVVRFKTEQFVEQQVDNKESKKNSQKLQYDFTELMKNYSFWKNNKEGRGFANIFKGVTEQQFVNMIDRADFTAVNKTRISQRVKFNIVVLSRLLGKEWGEKASLKLKTKLRESGKMTSFNEYDELNKMYLP